MSSPQPKPTVLIVDDDPQIRKMLHEVLSLEGFPTETASGGQEALDMLTNSSGPRVVLLDLLMPPFNGWDVLAQLESNPAERARHKIILISAWSNLEKYSTLSAEGRLPKPLTVDQLLNAIDAAVKARA